MKPKIAAKLWLVSLKENNQSRVLSFTNTKEEAEEYIVKRIILDNKAHFLPWCELHKKDPKSFETQNFYARTIMLNKAYMYKQIKYDVKHMAMIYRIAFECLPIGCSYDTDFEYAMLMERTARAALSAKLDDKKEEEKTNN